MPDASKEKDEAEEFEPDPEPFIPLDAPHVEPGDQVPDPGTEAKSSKGKD